MTGTQPNEIDRWAAHALVGLIVGGLVSTKAGVPGFIVGGFLAVIAHAALDAPLANALADLTSA